MMTHLFLILTALSALFSALEQKVMVADFTLTVSTSSNAQDPGATYPGTVTMRGRQFRFSMLGTQAAYDGATLYVYDEDVDEVTLSTPTEEELVEANPLLLAQRIEELCEVSERPVNPTEDGSDILAVFTPKEATKLPFTRLTLRIKAGAEPLPVSLEMKEPNQTTLLKLLNARYTDAAPDFTLSPSGAYINDLRE